MRHGARTGTAQLRERARGWIARWHPRQWRERVGQLVKTRGRALPKLFDSGNLRASVMGGIDGLVTSLALVVGVAATSASASTVLMAGVVGAVGGAASMAAGEWLSVTSQNEQYQRQLREMERLLHDAPQAAEAKLIETVKAKGCDDSRAAELVREVMESRRSLESAAADLGLVPKRFDSPVGAALCSFGAFLAGATVPLVPLVIGVNGLSLGLSTAVSGATLLAGGAWLASTSGRHPVVGALRMFALGAAAAAITYGTGLWAGSLFTTPPVTAL